MTVGFYIHVQCWLARRLGRGMRDGGQGRKSLVKFGGGRIVKIRIQAFFARKREKIFLTFFIHIPGNN